MRINIVCPSISDPEPRFGACVRARRSKAHGKNGNVKRACWYEAKVTVQVLDANDNMRNYKLNKSSLIEYIRVQQIAAGMKPTLRKGCCGLSGSPKKRVLDAFIALYPHAVTKQRKVVLGVTADEKTGIKELLGCDYDALPICKEKYLTKDLRKAMLPSIQQNRMMKGIDANGYPYVAIKMDYKADGNAAAIDGAFILRKEENERWIVYLLVSDEGLAPYQKISPGFTKDMGFILLQEVLLKGEPMEILGSTWKKTQ